MSAVKAVAIIFLLFVLLGPTAVFMTFLFAVDYLFVSACIVVVLTLMAAFLRITLTEFSHQMQQIKPHHK